mmetsp:Transcript_28243/g.65325  ORF Transcript_28243/g.65325 Transcript_28243/m.65325 type:complete len:343 (-) Transcript_28243:49-1077(-)
MGLKRSQAPDGNGIKQLEPVTARSRRMWEASRSVVPSLPVQIAPTKQPATWGQDMQECAWLSLPSYIQLAPKITTAFHTAGVWESFHGATFSSWSQALWPWSSEDWEMEVGSKVFMLAMPAKTALRAPQLEALADVGMVLPQRDGFSVPIVFKDCNGVPVYAVMENTVDPTVIEVYNRYGEFVAGSQSADESGDVIRYHDDVGAPLAIAQRLKARSNELQQGVLFSYRDVIPWEIQFMDDSWTNSSLGLAQNRWVIAATVQERALEDASRTLPISVTLMCLLGVVAAAACLLGLVVLLFLGIWRAVFPRQKGSNVRNIFLEDLQAYPSSASASAPLPGGKLR